MRQRTDFVLAELASVVPPGTEPTGTWHNTAVTNGSGRRRAFNLAVVAALGLALGVAGYVAVQVASRPAPRPAPGWQLQAEMPNPRGETASAVAGGKVYVAGGYLGLDFETTAVVSIYDAAADVWSDGPALPAPRNHAAAAELDGIVYVGGGSAPGGAATDTFWALTAAGAWEVLAPMPGARTAHRMVALRGRLYVVGGIGGPVEGPGAIGRVLVFDPLAGAWSEGSPMPLNRDHLGLVVIGDEIWAIGGRTGGHNHARVDIYNPATDTWREGPALPVATSGAAEAVVAGVIFLAGGEDPALAQMVDSHWQLDTSAALAWEPLQPPPLVVHGVPGLAFDGRFVVIGGSTRPGRQSNTAWTGATQVFQPAP